MQKIKRSGQPDLDKVEYKYRRNKWENKVKWKSIRKSKLRKW